MKIVKELIFEIPLKVQPNNIVFLSLGLQGYLSLWTLTTLMDTQKTLEHLAYMGYTFHSGEENQMNALTIASERKIDLAKKQTNRNVYRCHVIGPRDAGKTTFCQGLLERSLQDIEGMCS